MRSEFAKKFCLSVGGSAAAREVDKKRCEVCLALKVLSKTREGRECRYVRMYCTP